MSKFTIITRGIAASYLKNDAWKVLFPFDKCHKLRLQIDDGNNATINKILPNNENLTALGNCGIALGKRGVRIEISVTDPLSKTSEGRDYKDFLDLTARGLHRELKTTFPLDETDAVLMSIANAEFSAFDHVARGHRLVDPNDSRGSSAQFKSIGNSGKAEILGDDLTIRVTGLPTGSFSMVFSSDTTIVFDNDCYEQTANAKGDLEMLYTVLRDADTSTKQLIQESEKIENAVEAGIGAVIGAGAGVTAGVTAGAAAGSNGGASPNPAGPGAIGGPQTGPQDAQPTNPFQGKFGPEDGLPCNIFRISNPGSLPS